MSKGIDYILDQVIPDIMGTNNQVSYLPKPLNALKRAYQFGNYVGNEIASLQPESPEVNCQQPSIGMSQFLKEANFIRFNTPPLWNPVSDTFEAAKVLYDGKKEMDDMGKKYVNLYGTKNLGTEFSTQDDFAHSKSMCKAGQITPLGAIAAQLGGWEEKLCMIFL